MHRDPFVEAWLAVNRGRGLEEGTLSYQRWAITAFLHATDLDDARHAKYQDLATFTAKARKEGLLRRTKNGGITMGRPLDEASVRQVLSIISSFYHFLVEAGHLPAHPFPRRRHLTKSIKSTQTKRRALTVAELQRLVAHVRTPLDLVVVVLLAKTALRIEELCGLHSVDVNLRTGRMHLVRRDANGRRIGQGKYSKRTNSVVWMDAQALAVLQAYQPTRRGPPGLLLTTLDGRRLTKSYVNYQILRPLCLAAGLVGPRELQDRRRNITAHVFRHTWTSLVSQAGMREAYWMEYRGDLRRRHTGDQYLAIPEDDLRQEYLAHVFHLNLPYNVIPRTEPLK